MAKFGYTREIVYPEIKISTQTRCGGSERLPGADGGGLNGGNAQPEYLDSEVHGIARTKVSRNGLSN